MKEILKVNGPKGVLPSVYFKPNGDSLQDGDISKYLCDQVRNTSQENDLIVYMTPEEFDLAKKSLDARSSF